MELPVDNPSEDALPPEEVRIRKVSFSVQADHRRVRISMELTPFRIPPDIAVVITDGDDVELASTNIIGAMNSRLTFTMHLPELTPSSRCLFRAAVDYREQGTVDEVEKAFSLDNSSSEVG
ncbi:MAG: hypothetical protein P8Z42_09010 [Anaerolineales bacterium]|jgi:hypothetical protein